MRGSPKPVRHADLPPSVTGDPSIGGLLPFVSRLLDSTNDCVALLDLDGRLLFLSPNGQRALGADSIAATGSDWLELWNPAHRAAAKAVADVARAGGTGRFTAPSLVDGPRSSSWDVSLTPVMDAGEMPQQLLMTARNVTEAVRIQRELERSEERYRLIGESLPGTTWTATPDGLLDHISEGSASKIAGPVEARLGANWLSIVHPDDRERVSARWKASVEAETPYEIEFRIRNDDDAYRWHLVRALPQRDSRGNLVRWVGINIDIDERVRAGELREMFVALAENSGDFVAIADRAGDVLYFNPAAREMLSLESTSQTRLLECFAPEDREFVESVILPELERDERWASELRVRNARTGALIPILFNAFVLRDASGEKIGLATISRDLRERRRIDIGMRALVEASAVMFRSLDFVQTLRNVAEAVTRGFATYCIVDFYEPGGALRRVATHHRDPELLAALDRVVSVRRMDGAHPAVRALKQGESTLQLDAAEAWKNWLDASLVDAGDIAALAPRSFLVVPIRSPEDSRVIGAISCVVDARDPYGGYSLDDLRFAEEIAARAGLAFDHARSYERERHIAMTLQEASLPKTLPSIDGLQLSAEYRPGNTEAMIGGDWYDAFALDDSRLVITVGDVLGNGLASAVTMGKLRLAMQSAAMMFPEPEMMLKAADRTIRSLATDTYATALAGIYDSRVQEFTYASAGHPGPALRRADGSIEQFDAPGVLIGLRTEDATTLQIVPAAPGSTLVFFTDGLIEATRDSDEGYRRLHAAMNEPAVRAAANPAQAIVERVLRGRAATDDIAVLVVNVEPAPSGKRTSGGSPSTGLEKASTA